LEEIAVGETCGCVTFSASNGYSGHASLIF
jgi:hypothetical protein